MVLEKIVNITEVEHKPSKTLFYSIIITLVSILIGYRVFESSPGFAALSFIVIGSLPFIRKLIEIEEIEEANASNWKIALKRNRPTVEILFFFFLGVSITYYLISVFLPNFGEILFSEQNKVFSGAISHSLESTSLLPIIKNNLSIIILAILLSLLYGSGSIFVISWNASVLGTFLASKGLTNALLYIPHASLEFFGFFMAALAGSLISEAIEKHDYSGNHFKNILKDSTMLTLLSVTLIIIAAYVEVAVL